MGKDRGFEVMNGNDRRMPCLRLEVDTGNG